MCIRDRYDDRGTIAKRYRRQDEIGTPFCVTYDFDSEEDHCVTVRDRDTMEQERIAIDELDAYFAKKLDVYKRQGSTGEAGIDRCGNR